MINYIKELKETFTAQETWLHLKWAANYARRYWKSMVIYTLIGLSGTLFGIITGFLSKDMINYITGQASGPLVRTFLLFVGISIVNVFLTQVSTYFSNLISIRVDNEIKSEVFFKILITDWEAISTYHTGDLLTRWSSDVSTLSSSVLNWLPNLIIYTVRFISAFVIVAYHDITFAVLAFLGVPVSVLMSRTILGRMQANNKQSAAMNAKMSGFNQETFSNIQTIKAFDLVSLYQNKLLKLQQDYFNMRMDFQKMSMKTSILIALVGIIVSYVCYGWGIYQVQTKVITYGTMTLFLSMSASLTSSLNQLISLVPSAISISTSSGRLMDILEMPKDDYETEEQVSDMLKRSESQGLSLVFDNLVYGYNQSELVLDHVKMTAAPHEIVALVGPSGEGKTTLLRLMLGLVQAKEGKAFVTLGTGNGQDGLRLSLSAATRRLFSYVPQGNTMFSGTIAENMRNVRPDATDEEITEALKHACAWDFVQALPDGINSIIKERGGGFSEGQAQRLAIARGFLRKAPILLLDEATSALDEVTQRRVLKNIMREKLARTCIITTHRPSVLDICSKVYRVEHKMCRLLSQEEVVELNKEF